jgi:hypothetical protein
MILTMGLLLAGSAVRAQDQVQFTLSVSSDSVLLGHYLQVSFTLENAQGQDFAGPEFQDFDLLSGPNMSTNVQITNGNMRQTIRYQYYIKPRMEGLYYIEPASIRVGGRLLETAPLPIKVYPNPDGIEQVQPRSAQPSSPFEQDPFRHPFFEEFRFPSFDQLFEGFSLPRDLQPTPPPARERAPATPEKRKTTRI